MAGRKMTMASPASFKDMTGQRFTRLVVVSRAASDKNGNARWYCQCDCGSTTVSSGFTLRNGEAKSCGCLTTEQLVTRNTRHERCGTPEYSIWAGMLQRCLNEKCQAYVWYGARGIKVCDRWRSFDAFYADMGDRPSRRHSLERTNNEGDYEPGNVVWGTPEEQHNNKRSNHYVLYRSERMSLTKAINTAGSGISLSAARGRLARGWSVQATVETPPSENIYVPGWGRHRGTDYRQPPDKK